MKQVLLSRTRRPSTAETESTPLLQGDRGNKLDASQLKFYQGLSPSTRSAYMLRAQKNGHSGAHLAADASLTRTGKFLAGSNKVGNRIVCSAYNSFMITGIMAGIPGSKKLLNAVEKHENNRLNSRHAHQKEPFALDTQGVNEAMRNEYGAADEIDHQRIAAIAAKFDAPANYVHRVITNLGVVPLPFDLETTEINDAIRAAYAKTAGCDDEKVAAVAKQFATTPDYITRVVKGTGVVKLQPAADTKPTIKTDKDRILAAYGRASGCDDEKALIVARQFGISAERVKQIVNSRQTA
jgi:hypothetical protein